MLYSAIPAFNPTITSYSRTSSSSLSTAGYGEFDRFDVVPHIPSYDQGLQSPPASFMPPHSTLSWDQHSRIDLPLVPATPSTSTATLSSSARIQKKAQTTTDPTAAHALTGSSNPPGEHSTAASSSSAPPSSFAHTPLDDPFIWPGETVIPPEQLETMAENMVYPDHSLRPHTAPSTSKRSRPSDEDDERCVKKAKTTRDDDDNDDSMANGLEYIVRWATPVVQSDYQTEQGASARKDVPTHNNQPQFPSSTQTGPTAGSSNSAGKKGAKKGRTVKRTRKAKGPKRAKGEVKEKIRCPISPCPYLFDRHQEQWRHVCCCDEHENLRAVPGWEQRIMVPDWHKNRLMVCPFLDCPAHTHPKGIRRDKLNKHMRAHHGGLDVGTWLDNVATLIARRKRAGQWTDEDAVSTDWQDAAGVTSFVPRADDRVDGDLYDWVLRYVYWRPDGSSMRDV